MVPIPTVGLVLTSEGGSVWVPPAGSGFFRPTGGRGFFSRAGAGREDLNGRPE